MDKKEINALQEEFWNVVFKEEPVLKVKDLDIREINSSFMIFRDRQYLHASPSLQLATEYIFENLWFS